MNTLSLIVTLTIFLANGSMSKNLNRKPTINAPPHCPSGQFPVFHQYDNNGKGACGCAEKNDPCRTDKGPKGPNCIPADAKCGNPHHPAPGFNGTGINPNTTSVDMEPMPAFEEPMPAPQNMPGLNGAGINPNAKPLLKIKRIDAPRILQPTIHAMPGANGSGINNNSKISTDIKPMAPLPKIESTFATPSYAPEEVNAPLAPETVTRIKVDGDHADLPPINEEVVHSFAEKKRDYKYQPCAFWEACWWTGPTSYFYKLKQ